MGTINGFYFSDWSHNILGRQSKCKVDNHRCSQTIGKVENHRPFTWACMGFNWQMIKFQSYHYVAHTDKFVCNATYKQNITDWSHNILDTLDTYQQTDRPTDRQTDRPTDR